MRQGGLKKNRRGHPALITSQANEKGTDIVMRKIDKVVQEAISNNQKIYIRGTARQGFLLGTYFDSKGINFEGYVDRKPELYGTILWGNHICYSPDDVPSNSVEMITAFNSKTQEEIAEELEKKGISYIKDLNNEIRECEKEIDDETYVKNFHKMRIGEELNLDNPKTLNDKLNWLKLYNHDPLYTRLVDKYEVKKYVAERIGEKYIIPTYGVWEHFDDIDFDSLPMQFILKCTHDSGTFVIVEDKEKLNKEEAKEKLESALKNNFYYLCREWPYKNVKPRIIAEKYFDSLGKPESIEYKTTCFNGKVGFVTICGGIPHAEFEKRTNDHFTVDFEHMPWYSFYKHAKVRPEKPEQWDELINVCEKLAANIPYVRVDCYIIDGQIYFGEMTFYTWGGHIEFTPPEWNEKLGECLVLPSEKLI